MSAKRLTHGQQLIQRGEELGFRWGQYTMFMRQLRGRFGRQVTHDVELSLREPFRDASLDRIALYAERVLSAATMAEVLGD